MAGLARTLAVNQLASALEELIRAAVREGVETAVAGVLAEMPEPHRCQQQATDGPEELLTVTRVCERLSLSETKVRALISAGQLERIQVDRAVRVSSSSVSTYIERLAGRTVRSEISNSTGNAGRAAKPSRRTKKPVAFVARRA